MYFRLLLVPHPLTIDYYPFYIPYIGLADPRSLLPMLLYGCLTVLAILLTWRKHIAGFGLLFFLIGLFPVSNLLIIVGPFMGERLVFIPSAGFIMALTWVIIKSAERIQRQRWLPYIFSFLLLAYTARTMVRNTDWKDSYTLYTRDVQTSVNSAVITKGAGHEILLRAEAANEPSVKKAYARQAIPYLEQAVKLNKSTTETFLLGNAYYENGEYEKSLGMYLETLALSSDYKKARTNYFIAVNRLEPPSLKIRYYDLLILKTGASYEAFYQKGLVFGKEMNQPDSSISNLVRASSIDSTQVDCLSDLGVALAIKGEYAKSANYLEKALRINPTDSRIRQNLVMLYRNTGNHSRADALSGK
jgi:tetratricopeptide (TPR) repeat protein